MRVSTIVIAAALALPATAFAQYHAGPDARAVAAQENLRQYQQNAPLASSAEQRLNDLDQRVRTQQNLESVTPAAGPAYHRVDQLPDATSSSASIPPSVIDLDAQQKLAERELSAENARLRAYNKP